MFAYRNFNILINYLEKKYYILEKVSFIFSVIEYTATNWLHGFNWYASVAVNIFLQFWEDETSRSMS